MSVSQSHNVPEYITRWRLESGPRRALPAAYMLRASAYTPRIHALPLHVLVEVCVLLANVRQLGLVQQRPNAGAHRGPNEVAETGASNRCQSVDVQRFLQTSKGCAGGTRPVSSVARNAFLARAVASQAEIRTMPPIVCVGSKSCVRKKEPEPSPARTVVGRLVARPAILLDFLSRRYSSHDRREGVAAADDAGGGDWGAVEEEEEAGAEAEELNARSDGCK